MTVTIRPKKVTGGFKTIVIGGGSVAQCGNGIKSRDEGSAVMAIPQMATAVAIRANQEKQALFSER